MKNTSHTIHFTRNHKLFILDESNREIRSNAKLKALMEQHGWLPEFPAVVVEAENGKLLIKDGQHRLHYAEELGLGVYYVITQLEEMNVSQFNCSQRPWKIEDYVSSFANQGFSEYKTLLSTSKQTGLGVRFCARLLRGGSEYSKYVDELKAGTWKASDTFHFDQVMLVVSAAQSVTKFGLNTFFISAISLIIKHSDVSVKTLADRIKANPGIMVLQPTVVTFISMIETVYNRHSRSPIPIVTQVKEGIRATAVKNTLSMVASRMQKRAK